jgi:lipid kinase, YegS/Rv2252/BmrU family
MKKAVYTIINPVSGTGSKTKIKELLSNLGSEGYDVTLLQTEYRNHAAEIAQKAVKDKIDIVIAVGGDGTVNEVASALVGSNVALGIIPTGSGNGLARHLGLPLNEKKAVDIIKKGVIERIDYGKANGRMFFCTCGVGYDALVSEKALNKKSRGKLMYAGDMLATYVNYKPEHYKIICAESTFEGEAFVITFANASQYGYNAYIAPNATLSDGKMNIAILKPISFIDVPEIGAQMFLKHIGDNKNFKEIITSKATIIREKDGVMHIDGNAIYESKEIEVEIIPCGLSVIVSENSKI